MRDFRNKIIHNWQILREILEKYRMVGKIIGFTNGCFDILHKGHIYYLYQAKEYCDVLVVGINTDESVRRIKGYPKPINSLEERMVVISALEAVDFVTPFEQDTPIDLIEYLKPDVYFKGGDYKDKAIPEMKVIEKYRIDYKVLVFVPDSSTSRIIERIIERGGK
ncbi:MAG: adenylyltransferase/cytidyltransferase family protein [Candidatus Calescibacterium sp.]|nr:adenylyltransferase/cytidyltransferase family protein [Candidatus Calescibacterium sp.]MCX7971720.1 adenylyltransferase/cytidyltransferase family protein [bacterium]MDW8195326.1 adenylyltransferase/cytidyltransferase family protein [Candidatus Calescibacterium sp.]